MQSKAERQRGMDLWISYLPFGSHLRHELFYICRCATGNSMLVSGVEDDDDIMIFENDRVRVDEEWTGHVEWSD